MLESDVFAISHLLSYLAISVWFTLWVGRNLHRNGRVFIIQAFNGNEDEADAVNQLLLVGFYLVNFGIVSLCVSLGGHPENLIQLLESLAVKIGGILVVLGGMHYYNMRNISNMRYKALVKQQFAKEP